ncbi:MAG: hypothetical protein HOV78_11475 [Hamadaea sp.]|nr:hypothetical protein [Hamadaea sp.]
MRAPILATAANGEVMITCDSAAARMLSDAVSMLHATSVEREAIRPDWFRDVVEILLAAAQADVQLDRGPRVAEVPLLRVVGGEPRC